MRLFCLFLLFINLSLSAAEIFYVSTSGSDENDGKSWDCAFLNIQKAINTASTNASDGSPAHVYISAGKYFISSSINLANNVEVYGGFRGNETSLEQRSDGFETILAGTMSAPVILNSSSLKLNESAKLDSVTITSDNTSKDYAIGIDNQYSSPTFTNCKIIGLPSTGVRNFNCSPIFKNCLITKNNGGVKNGGVFIDCEISYNASDSSGGGVYDYYSNYIELYGCKIIGNSAYDGGGICGAKKVVNCLVKDNKALNYGGGINNATLIKNTTITSNVAYVLGGGVYCSNYQGTQSQIVNSTICDNISGQYSGIFINAGNVAIVNSIIWQNTGISQFGFDKYQSSLTILKSIIDTELEDVNIIKSNPLLSKAGYFGGSIDVAVVSSKSPAIGAGINQQDAPEGITIPTTDARGFARNSSITIGAAQYQESLSEIFVYHKENTSTFGEKYQFTLEAFAEGENLSYQWFKDGVAVAGATNSTITITQPASTVDWTVKVYSDTESKTSAPTRITTTQGVMYVSQTGDDSNDGFSWETAKRNPQEAIDIANYGTQIFIAKGTYVPDRMPVITDENNPREKHFALKDNAISIYGGFAGNESDLSQRILCEENKTIFSGDLDGNDVYDTESGKCLSGNEENTYIVFKNLTPIFSNVKLDAITITGGNPNDSYNSVYVYNYGGAMYNDSLINITLTNCIIRGNSARGGVVFNNNSSLSTFLNCTFSGNFTDDLGGTIINKDNSNSKFINCIISKNSSTGPGIGVYTINASPIFDSCLIEGNYCVTNTTNSQGGAFYFNKSKSLITNCTILNNAAGYEGGAFYSTNSPITVVNSTICSNSALYGSFLYDYESVCKFVNCIIWNNFGSTNIISGKPEISYSIVQENYSGEGILSIDPLMMKLSNYGGSTKTISVCENSPAIGAGLSSAAAPQGVSIPQLDARGFPRDPNFITIGANQFQKFLTSVYIDTKESQSKFADDYKFTLQAHADGQNLSYQWYKNGQKISDANNNFYTTSQADVNASYTVEISDANTTLSDSMSIYAKPAIMYVSQLGDDNNDGASWINAKRNLQPAIDASYYGMKIFVAKGKYNPVSRPNGGSIDYNNTKHFALKSNTALYGGFAGNESNLSQRSLCAENKTILSGDLNNDDIIDSESGEILENLYDNSYNVFINIGLTGNTLIDGFTIEAGNSYSYTPDGKYTYGAGFNNIDSIFTISNCEIAHNQSYYGGGIYNKNSKVKLSNCTIAKNKVKSKGAGISCEANSDIIIEDSIIDSNMAEYDATSYWASNGGAISAFSSDIRIQNCKITNNSAKSGGAIILSSGNLHLAKTSLLNNQSYNSGGAIDARDSNLNISDCQFTANSSSVGNGGAAILSNCDCEISNTCFSKNTALLSYGGSLYAYDKSLSLINCTFEGNSATDGGAIYANELKMKILNSTITNNKATNNADSIFAYNAENENVLIANSIIWNNGTNNLVGKFKICYSVIEGGYEGIGNISTSPMLSPLSDNGGYSYTAAVKSTSSAIKTAANTEEIAAIWGEEVVVPDTDARGLARATPTTIGAYEFGADYNAWAINNGLDIQTGAPEAKPFEDNITNLEKFTFGLNPKKSSTYSQNPLFKTNKKTGGVEFQFPIHKNATDVTVKIYKSSNLIDWTEIEAYACGESGDFKLFKSEETITGTDRVFFKLKLNQY